MPLIIKKNVPYRKQQQDILKRCITAIAMDIKGKEQMPYVLDFLFRSQSRNALDNLKAAFSPEFEFDSNNILVALIPLLTSFTNRLVVSN